VSANLRPCLSCEKPHPVGDYALCLACRASHGRLTRKEATALVEENARLRAAHGRIAALPFGSLTDVAREIARKALVKP
jgi:hypothetical protein